MTEDVQDSSTIEPKKMRRRITTPEEQQAALAAKEAERQAQLEATKEQREQGRSMYNDWMNKR